MRDKRKTGIILSFVVVLLLPGVEATSAASGTEKLDSFYATEFKKFNEAFEKHIQQVDKCLGEMDRFEKGDIFLDPIECPKFDKMRPEAASLLKEIKVVVESYVKWLNILSDETVENATKLSSPANNMTNALIQIYSTKFQKALIQTKRVRKQEEELVNEINKLSETLKRLNTIEKNEDAKKPNKQL